MTGELSDAKRRARQRHLPASTAHADARRARSKRAGYRTGAFVGAFVLDARFGLNAGFDVYDDRMLGSGATLEVVQRSAEQVLAPAYDWITESEPSSRASSPAPSPEPPAPDHVPGSRGSTSTIRTSPTRRPSRTARATPPTPYAGEIAYADAALGTFLDRLRGVGALDQHAGRHRVRPRRVARRARRAHARPVRLRRDAARAARACGRRRRCSPAVVADTVRLVDVMPTILDLVGVAAAARVDGRSAAAVHRRRAAVRRSRLVLRSAQRQPRPAAGRR